MKVDKNMNNIYTIPNLITMSRLVAIPIIIGLYLSDIYILRLTSFFIFLYASLSDFIDGYLARKLNQTSLLGKILDPIADKLLVILMFMLFLGSPFLNLTSLICIYIIAAREIIIMTLREVMANYSISIDVIGLSKIKTAIQFISLIFLFIASLQERENLIITQVTNWLILLSAIVTIITLVLYIQSSVKQIKGRT